MLGTCAFQQTILLVCASTVQRERVRMSAIFVRANTHTLQDYQCNLKNKASGLFSNSVTDPCECAMCSVHLRLSPCVSPSLAHSCLPSLTDSFLSPYLPPSLCPIQCLHRYVGQTTVPDSNGWRLPPQHETSVLEELS